ncbi:MAG: DUF2442 domain-containing protein [Gammaproteobacteria bacterium]
MSSLPHGYGEGILPVKVMSISGHGIWPLYRGKKLFMSYDDFPWFKEQPVKAILNVEEQSPGHFYWPDIDVDLTEQIIEYPERYPLVAKSR